MGPEALVPVFRKNSRNLHIKYHSC